MFNISWFSIFQPLRVCACLPLRDLCQFSSGTRSLFVAQQNLFSRIVRRLEDRNHLVTNHHKKFCAVFPWLKSHVSTDTFFENKCGFPESELNTPFVGSTTARQVFQCPSLQTSRLLPTCTGLSRISRRGFKSLSPSSELSTARQSFMESIIRYLGLGPRASEEIPPRQDGLRNLLSNQNLSERQRLQVAFAEGYFAADPRSRTTPGWRVFKILRYVLAFTLLLTLTYSFMNIGGSFMGTPSQVRPEDVDVTFEDVKGIGEAKLELQEIVEYLRQPAKFSTLGGKLPKGVLLVGPPGTGKTLLARAVAGEAKVPFFRMSGSEFDEMFVGQGARRVRDLFRVAKMRAPCVIFIDEIDSVGSQRADSIRYPFASQTINQLLTEMDGFKRNDGVIVLGATNRREQLDDALLRPGRFDVEIQIPIPDMAGRKEIITHYLSKVKMDTQVNIDILSKSTTGFTGAAIESMINQAALKAAMEEATAVTMSHIENAIDKLLMGIEWKTRILSQEEKILTAYHEGGHALVAYYTQDADKIIHKVTILPRGPSLGHTAFIPEKEEYSIPKSRLMAEMDVLMGGRAAEEIIFGPEKVTTGAADDLAKATELAGKMVKQLGMCEDVGLRTFTGDGSSSMMPRDSFVVVNDLAQSTQEAVDQEINRLLNESYKRAKTILSEHKVEHRHLAEALLKYETLDNKDVKAILSGKQIRRETTA